GQRLLETAGEPMVGKSVLGGRPYVGSIGDVMRDEAETQGHVTGLIEIANVREDTPALRAGPRLVQGAESPEGIRGHIERVGDADNLRRLVPHRVPGHPLQLPGCSVRLDSVLAGVDAAYRRRHHLLFAPREFPRRHGSLHGPAMRP